jgi:hypothetical protein
LGDLLRAVAAFVPPPRVAASPLRWGTAQGLLDLFGDAVVVERSERKLFMFRYQSAAHFIDIFRRFYGPTHKAFEALDPDRQRVLEHNLTLLLEDHNVGRNGLVVPGEYLETVLRKRPGAARS